ncbi:hypothetical protein PR048_031039 [Dryococelus australis]|uniref:Uncharacterized protein n=1 Tax=Dryococelus australis TaxID=614101 RepID=A0ABQ9G470_9NEOP|nr:hypothetical protein PR048_031039 [Dryococelus australis]
MEQHRNARAGETGNPRKNLTTSGIGRHYFHILEPVRLPSNTPRTYPWAPRRGPDVQGMEAPPPTLSEDGLTGGQWGWLHCCGISKGDGDRGMPPLADGSTSNEKWNKKQGKREIPEKTRDQRASSDTIPTCENPGVTPVGIEPGSIRCNSSSKGRRGLGEVYLQTPRCVGGGMSWERKEEGRCLDEGELWHVSRE